MLPRISSTPEPVGVLLVGPVAAALSAPDAPVAGNDSVIIRSPFDVGAPRSQDAAAKAPEALTMQLDAAQPAELDTVHRILLASLGGLGLLGTLGLGGCAMAPPTPDAARVQQVDTAAALRTRARVQATAANDEQIAQNEPSPARRMKVLGQDVGAASDGLENVTWSTYSATYRGQTYEIEYPKGWKTLKTPHGLAVVNPQKPEEYVAFQWRQGAGAMSADNLISSVFQEGGLHRTHVNSEQHQVRDTPNGDMETLSSDISYTVEGIPVRGQFLAGVTNMQNGVSIWSGFITATQSTEQDFVKDQPILLHVGNSLTVK